MEQSLSICGSTRVPKFTVSRSATGRMSGNHQNVMRAGLALDHKFSYFSLKDTPSEGSLNPLEVDWSFNWVAWDAVLMCLPACSSQISSPGKLSSLQRAASLRSTLTGLMHGEGCTYLRTFGLTHCHVTYINLKRSDPITTASHSIATLLSSHSISTLNHCATPTISNNPLLKYINHWKITTTIQH